MMKKQTFLLVFACLLLVGAMFFLLRKNLANPPDAYWDWCPENTVSIKHHFNNKTYSSPADLQRYCHIPYSTKVPAPKITADTSFELFLSAKNKNGDQTYLEFNRQLGLLRANTRVFDSKPHQLQNLL